MDLIFLKSTLFLFILLNPFFMSVYLMDAYSKMDRKTFAGVLIRGACIATGVFIVCAIAGDKIFSDLLQARFSSFLVFGGIVFLIMSIRFVFQGEEAIIEIRGNPKHIAGYIAMPFMVGPATVGASILSGSRLSMAFAILSIVIAVASTTIIVIVLKAVYDEVKSRNEALIQRYVEVVGRIMALVVGTIAVEMIFQGLEVWLQGLKLTSN